MQTLARGQGPAGKLMQTLLCAPVIGEGLFNLLVSRPSLRYFSHKVYSDPAFVEEHLIEQNYQTSHQPNARFAPASFIAGALDTPVDEEYMRLAMPILLLWGKNARFTPLEHAEDAPSRHLSLMTQRCCFSTIPYRSRRRGGRARSAAPCRAKE